MYGTGVSRSGSRIHAVRQSDYDALLHYVLVRKATFPHDLFASDEVTAIRSVCKRLDVIDWSFEQPFVANAAPNCQQCSFAVVKETA